MFSFNFECSHLGWEPAPWGEGARVWVRAAAPVGLGGLAAIRRPPRTAGATDCAQGRGGGGTMRQKGICAPELRGRRGLTCDMRGCLRPIEIRLGARPLGGGRTGMGAGGSSCGVAGRAALPWDPPLPWLYGGGYHLGRMDAMRTALADTAQITQGGSPPYLRAV